MYSLFVLLSAHHFQFRMKDDGIREPDGSHAKTQNHTVSGVPTHFVHPCNTADALRDVAGVEEEPTTETYLLLWLGLVGSCVNLHVPSAIFEKAGNG
jgi:hypothetical protein